MYWKGFDTLVEALGRLADDGHEFTLDVVGTPPEEEARSLLSDHGLANHVRFVGRVDRSDIPKHYRRADVLVNPSRYETLGMTSVEARACGTPVVGSDLDVFEDKNTLTFETGNPESLATTLKRFLSDPKRYQENALESADDFGMESSIEFLVGVYEDVVGD